MNDAATLSITNVDKTFALAGSERQVLGDVSLDIAAGEFVSIVGASGCGKSTLLRLIMGLDTVFEGTITLDGQAVRGPGLDRGIMFQDSRLLPWLTVEQNVAFGALNAGLSSADKQSTVGEHITLVGLEGFEKAHPHQLSGGMAQRVALARALVNRPRLLLLDEPFAALDALTRARMQDELHRIWRMGGATMILVTHDVDEAIYLADRVVVMEPSPGRIKQVLDVSAAHPRDRGSATLGRLKAEILRVFLNDPPLKQVTV